MPSTERALDKVFLEGAVVPFRTLRWSLDLPGSATRHMPRHLFP